MPSNHDVRVQSSACALEEHGIASGLVHPHHKQDPQVTLLLKSEWVARLQMLNIPYLTDPESLG